MCHGSTEFLFARVHWKREVEEVEMRTFLECDIVEPSLSPGGTSNIMVPKKKLPDGTSGCLRVTADMRAVNSVRVGDAFGTEGIGMILDWLAKQRWFSVADAKDGYWNVHLADGSRCLTAVKTVVGLVQYTRTTMGLKNAGGFFQRLVNNVYAGLKGRSMQADLDDITAGSDTPAQHIANVRDMLQRTKDARLRLKLEKCSFGKAEVEILDHKVSFGEVRPTTSIENVYNIPPIQRTPPNC
jgi:Reverse transcriptase (RNA-dependent DNA polymerase)